MNRMSTEVPTEDSQLAVFTEEMPVESRYFRECVIIAFRGCFRGPVFIPNWLDVAIGVVDPTCVFISREVKPDVTRLGDE